MQPVLLREDEIEALLRFDDAKLEVVYRDDLMGKAGAPYTAVITYRKPPNVSIKRESPSINIARTGETRMKAVRAVWEVYKQYRVVPTEEKQKPEWLYEHAMADVELQLKKLLEEMRNGKK